MYTKERTKNGEELGEDVLWGGDCANSVQTQLNKVLSKKSANKNYIQKIEELGFKEFCGQHGCIGNFVLVPAYINCNRPGSDNWQAALKKLMPNSECETDNKWNIVDNMINHSKGLFKNVDTKVKAEAQAKELYKPYEKKHFNKYINTMFLWDYVEKVGKENIKY